MILYEKRKFLKFTTNTNKERHKIQSKRSFLNKGLSFYYTETEKFEIILKGHTICIRNIWQLTACHADCSTRNFVFWKKKKE